MSSARPLLVADAGDHDQRPMDRDVVRDALLSLPDCLRLVMVEVYLRHRSVADVAAVLGISPGTVKSRSFHGLRALREALLARGLRPRDEVCRVITRRAPPSGSAADMQE